MTVARRLLPGLLFFGALTAIPAGSVRAEDLRLVKDLATGAVGSSPTPLGVLGGHSYFAATSSDFGTELWRSDGTAEGTALFKDLMPGPGSSTPRAVLQVGDVIYFLATDRAAGRELWKTDGSKSGTVLVRDLTAGPLSTFWRHFEPRAVAAGDRLFFDTLTFTGPSTASRSLGVSDGTESGTILLQSLDAGFFGGWLRAVGDRAYFALSEPSDPPSSGGACHLWASDGTLAGTGRVRQIGPGNRCPYPVAELGGKLLFSAFTEELGYELWESDGTEAGTRLLKEIWPGSEGSHPGACGNNPSAQFEAVRLGRKLFFSARDPRYGCELWYTDGTEEGTRFFFDAAPPPNSESLGPSVSLGEKFVFYSYGWLWVSDGTAEGTAWLGRRGEWMPPSGDRRIEDRLTAAGLAGDASGRRAFFQEVVYSDKWGTDLDLWITDGTQAGTRWLSAIAPTGSWPWPEVNGRFVFAGDDTEEGAELGVEPWAADARGGGGIPLLDVNAGGSSYPRLVARLGGRLLFAADDGVVGAELWRTDGTTAGTSPLRRINDGTGGSWPEELVQVDRRIYFAAGGDGAGRELWRTDGTAAGTYLVRDIAPGSSSSPSDLTPVEDRLFFRAAGDGDRSSLFVSDGTASGTREVEGVSYPANLLGAGRYLYYSTLGDGVACELWRHDGDSGIVVKATDEGRYACAPVASLGDLVFFRAEGSLWRSDGRPTGTFALPLPEVEGGTASSAPTAVGDRLYVAPWKGLWVTDGTVAGSRRLVKYWAQDVTPSGVGDGIFFLANDGVNGNSLQTSDGTREGTRLVRDFRPAGDDTYIEQVFGGGQLGATVFFTVTANRERSGHEAWLWRSDGSRRETKRVAPVPWRRVGRAVALDGALYFAAEDPATGVELWRTDGSRKGTRLVADLEPGPASSTPSELTVAGNRLYFVATRGGEGRELWVLEPGGDPVARLPKVAAFALDDRGNDEVAVLRGSKLTLLDRGLGSVRFDGPFAPSPDWEAVDFEAVAPGADVAIAARKRGRGRVYFVNASSAEARPTVALERTGDLLELEVVPAGGSAYRALLLSREGLGGPSRITIRRLGEGDGIEPSIGLPDGFDARDLEVVRLAAGGGAGYGAVVLGRSSGGPRLLTYDVDTGELLGDRELSTALLAVDLEALEPGPSPRVAVLAERRRDGAARVLALDPLTGEILSERRLKKSRTALDLESVPAVKGASGSTVGVLWVAKDGRGRAGVSFSNALTGEPLGVTRLPGLQRPRDLALVRAGKPSREPRIAVVGEAACGDRRDRLDSVVTVWEKATGHLVGCHLLE